MSRRSLTTILFWLAWAAGATALVAPTVIWAKRAHDATLSAAREDVTRATESSAYATESVISVLDVLLKRLSEAAGDADLRVAGIDSICPSLICSNNRRPSTSLLVAFTRPNGDVIVSAPELPAVSLADRDYFIAQKEKDAGLQVGLPRRTPFAEGMFLPLSRRMASKDVAFNGIVAAAFNTDIIRTVFQGQGIGRLDRIRLLDAEGHPLVDWSAVVAEPTPGTVRPETKATCRPSGLPLEPDAMTSTVKLPTAGLSVVACRSSANALQHWRDEVALIAGAEAIALLAAGFAVPAIRRRWDSRRRQQMGLRGLVAGSSDVQFIIAAKPDGRFVLEALTFSRSGELGRMSARLIGRTTREFFSPEDVDLIESDYRSVLASGQTRRTERKVSLGSGEFTWSTVLVPLNDAGEPGGYIYGAATELAGAGDAELEGGLRRFTEDVLRREDDERRRIARELHDTTGQNLIAASFELGAVERGLVNPSPQVSAALSHARSLVNASVSELRTLAYVLHPALLDEAGLGVALPTLAEGFEKRAGVRVAVTVAEELAGRRWLPEVEIALYRVAQEALTNVQRHSAAKAARVSLLPVASGYIELLVEDGAGGRPGCDPLAAPVVEGAGIRGMRDRIEALGGSLAVTPRDGGFRVAATVPDGANSS